jgi:hypothetical protein
MKGRPGFHEDDNTGVIKHALDTLEHTTLTGSERIDQKTRELQEENRRASEESRKHRSSPPKTKTR